MGLFTWLTRLFKEKEQTSTEAGIDTDLSPKLPEERPEGIERKETCSFEGCNNEVVDGGTCPLCGKKFCEEHKTPASHNCPKKETTEESIKLPEEAPSPGENTKKPEEIVIPEKNTKKPEEAQQKTKVVNI